MIRNELMRLGELAEIGIALAFYAEAIADGGRFKQSERKWVMRPNNFVTIGPHYQRTTNLAISLRGNPSEFPELPELPLKQGMAGYSECTVAEPKQLAAAALYIRRANDIYERGRTRVPRRQRLVEN